MSSQELAACILQRFGKPLEARSLTLAVNALHSNFHRRKDGILEFDRSSYPGKWRLTHKIARLERTSPLDVEEVTIT